MKKKRKYILSIVFTCLLSISFACKEVQAVPNDGYKLVNFKTKTVNENTIYIEEGTGKQGYLNGYYGADAVYLGSSGDKVKFKLSGVVGYVSKDEVEVVPMETNSDYDKYYTSFYTVADGVIQHKISKSLYSITYGTVPIGKNTVGLVEGKNYLSYDGHYFYPASLTGYKQMTDDYIRGNYSHAVNAGRPYYNYYQYLTHRTKTNYTATDIANYINYLGYTSKVTDWDTIDSHPYESQLFGEQDSFINNQNTFGANAIMMFGLAMNESAYGRSWISVAKNNLFGHNAYDSTPGASASGYEKVSDSIWAHAKYFVSIDYMDPNDYLDRYKGGHFGNKASGFNVGYASDPYWGEKNAYFYYKFEVPNGFQDFGTYTLGIKTDNKVYNIYKEPDSSSNALYTTGSVSDYPVVILEEVTGSSINGNNKWYKIQTDPVLNNSRTAFVQDVGEYDYDNNYAYIHSNAIEVVIKNGVSSINKTYTITFDANGGEFEDSTSTKTVNVLSGQTPEVSNPTKEGYDFIEWNETVVPASGNKTYTAKWQAKEYTVTFDANGGTFKDGKTKREINVSYKNIPTVDDPLREGYIFAGWTPNVVEVTEKTTYKALWEKSVFYDITFNADGGTFSNGKETLVVSTAEGKVPDVEAPIKDGYIFIGWTPELTQATEETSYEAIWKKGTIEDIRTKKSGNFYLEYLKESNGNLMIKGYQTINGINNTLDVDINYELVFESENNGNVFRQKLTRIMNEKQLGRPAVGSGKYNYTYSWFEGNIDINKLEQGNYKLFIIAYTDQMYSKNVVNNLLYKQQSTNYDTKNKYSIIRTDVTDDYMGIEMIVRDEKLGTKETSYLYAQYDQFRNLSFSGSKMNLMGYSYSYGTDYSKLANVKRTIIFENVDNYKKYTYNLGSTEKGLFKVTLPTLDGYDKTRAWYDASIDLSSIEPGTYAIYISNKTNVSDFGELKDVLYKDLSNVKTTINGKKYQFYRNDELKHRLELIVQ